MPKSDELKLSRALREAIEKAGGIVTKIEPTQGSSIGVPDLLVSFGVDIWAEIKVSNQVPHAQFVWDSLLRPSQRRWIINRYELVKERTIIRMSPVFVVVGYNKNVALFSFSMFRNKLIHIDKINTLDGVIQLFRQIGDPE